MDYAQLRNLLEPLVTGLKDAGTHTMLPTLCEELGLCRRFARNWACLRLAPMVPSASA